MKKPKYTPEIRERAVQLLGVIPPKNKKVSYQYSTILKIMNIFSFLKLGMKLCYLVFNFITQKYLGEPLLSK